MAPRLDNRSSATGVLMALTVLFLSVWLVLVFFSIKYSILTSAASKIFGMLGGFTGALLLIMKTEPNHNNDHPLSPPPEVPTQQNSEVKKEK